MRKLWFLSLPLLTLLLNACGASEKSEVMAYAPKTAVPEQALMSDGEVWNQELRVLQKETPRTLNMESFYKDFGYSEWPGKIYAHKKLASDKNQDDSPAHKFLIRLGQQIYQQALLGDKSGDPVYSDNALLLIRRLLDSKLGFINNPDNPSLTNDNRFLEIAWFLNLAVRGARILDVTTSDEWKSKYNWAAVKAGLNAWMGDSVDQNWTLKDALNQSPLNLAAHAGLLNWVGDSDTTYGSTNRSFAALEALLRVAEFRGGRLGPMKLLGNAWDAKREHDGSVWHIMQSFKGYLKYYFHAPINRDNTQFKLNYKKSAGSLINSNPDILNMETCLDPSNYGFRANCLVNKDAYRNDTFHPLMGFASLLNIIDLVKRWGYDLSPEEHERVIMGLRWVSLNNTPGVTAAKSSNGIAVWEVAFRLYPADKLGPYCQRDLAANRASDNNKRADLAWGYSRVALGY
ncbi:MAG TPA: hypothetical protein VE954_04515 [Oligoflexus sp.]|uniref:hypothetical protein n=1 Tax=Oligoflexus sp. TaxID=1971216 RepID=UPI002D6BB01B|nr:hypothetical protein [Oligoflexus sp.]HYX32353.1 hypothetical protein [Oligoflexus sp.]